MAREKCREARRLPRESSFHAVDFAEGPDGPFDVVVSNPPYIRERRHRGLAAEVRDHDPHAALDGGPDGLDAYRAILARADTLVAEGGLAGASRSDTIRARAVAALCRRAGLAT